MAMKHAPSSLTQIYEEILDKFDDACASADVGTNYRQRSLQQCFKRKNSGPKDFDVCLDLFIFLRWKWRSADRSQSHRTKPRDVAVVVQVQEEINGLPIESIWRLKKSTVRLSYYSCVSGNELLPLHTIHFDYSEPSDLHPVFHAQLCRDPVYIPDNLIKEMDVVDRFPSECGKNSCFQTARIPTSDMTFSSVLLSLAADHFGLVHFREFRQQLERLQTRLPRPAFEKMRLSLFESDHLRSFHWYADTD